MNSAASRLHNTDLSWERSFLDWFSRLPEVALFEYRRELGGFHYHQFISRFHMGNGRVCGAFGRSQDRMQAAIKCAAEYVERKAMLDYFSAYAGSLPLELHTSNGWAVHRSAALAKEAAIREVMERHLLLKSYLALGWSGFRLVDVIETPEIKLHFLTAAHRTDDDLAGLVAAQSPQYPGVSFGYCLGPAADVSEIVFWESGLFEAIDRILMLDGERIDLSLDPQSWILKTSKELLEDSFDPSYLREGRDQVSFIEPGWSMDIEVFDLTERWKLGFPLFAAYAHSSKHIPLFPPTDLQAETAAYLRSVLNANGIEKCDFPLRHPIL